MTKPPLAVSLYLLNGAILLTHEIDSAYWKEWHLFGIGGGIQAFLAINFVMALAILVGLDQFARGERAGRVFPLVLAATLIVSPIQAHFAYRCLTYCIRRNSSKSSRPV